MSGGLGERSRQVYSSLRERIIGGALAPGTRLPSYPKLAAEFGLAPMTVRQALARLEAEGLITCEHGRGTFVCARAGPGVLIVDDEASVRGVLRGFVTQAGYRTVEASGPAEGLAALARDSGIVLVLSDVRMPDTAAGVTFISTVRRRWPNLPLAAVTGYPGDLAELHGSPECPVLIVPKPVRARQMEEVLRLAHAEARGRAFRALHELAVAASGVLDPADLARIAVQHARELLGADGATLVVWNAETSALHYLAQVGTGAPPPSHQVASGVGTLGQAFATRSPIVVEDYQNWQHAVPQSLAAGLWACAAVPLVIGERALGALGVRAYSPHHFAPEQVQLLSLIAAQVAPALEAARLHAESEQRRAEAEALAELALQGIAAADTGRVIGLVTTQACQLLGADYSAVAMPESDGRLFVTGMRGNRSEHWRTPTSRIPGGTGLTGRALRERRTVIVEQLGDNPDFPADEFPLHVREGGRTLLGAPLFGRDGPLGALLIGWRRDATLTAAQVRLAEALASHAATILDNARAHAAATARLEELAGQRH
jgi:GAF domain-containing protein/DNA-binding transcriptional regulator YhcF (GntR family)